MRRERIDIEDVLLNEGQIEGVPSNPRKIDEGRFESLCRSVRNLPEMTEARDLLVYPHGGKFVVLGGNMRLRAYRELGWKEVPCCILPEEMPAEKLRAIVMQDNNPFGETDWDMVANEWDVEELKDWGVGLPEDWNVSPDDFGDKFSLPDGDKKPFQQMTFTFSDMEADLIKSALEKVKNECDFNFMEFGGNENAK